MTALAVSGAAIVGLAIPSASADPGGRYQVRRGDTLSQVAQQLGVDLDQLAAANGIGDHDAIYAGTWLTVPAGRSRSGGSSSRGGGATAASTYTVRPGDTLIGIATRFGLTPSTLAAANGIGDLDLVRSGTTLQIPAGAGGSSGGPGAAAPGSGAPAASSGGARAVDALRASGRWWLYGSMQRWASVSGVPTDLLAAMTYLESGWQAGIVSPTGAIGVGQLMPDTIRLVQQRIGLALNPWNPDDNTRMTAAYLRLLLDQTGWDASQALAAYYQGLGALRSHGMYAGTRGYVDGVQALRSAFA